MSDSTLVFDYLRARLRLDERRQDGSITAEVAVVTFLLVAMAIVVLGVIYTAAKGNADSIPTPEQPG